MAVKNVVFLFKSADVSGEGVASIFARKKQSSSLLVSCLSYYWTLKKVLTPSFETSFGSNGLYSAIIRKNDTNDRVLVVTVSLWITPSFSRIEFW